MFASVQRGDGRCRMHTCSWHFTTGLLRGFTAYTTLKNYNRSPHRGIERDFLTSGRLWRLRGNISEKSTLGFGTCWTPTWKYEKTKVAPRNSMQKHGLEIFRSLLCVRKRAFPFTVIYVFLLMFCPPGDAATGRILGTCLGSLPRLGLDKFEVIKSLSR